RRPCRALRGTGAEAERTRGDSWPTRGMSDLAPNSRTARADAPRDAEYSFRHQRASALSAASAAIRTAEARISRSTSAIAAIRRSRYATLSVAKSELANASEPRRPGLQSRQHR